ncbi:MAG TPA: hypothetical protein VGH96_14525, partial [Streptosporangiaceae bacterium]
MLAAQRRDYLIEVLRRDGKIVAKSVAADLGLSEDTDSNPDLCQNCYQGVTAVCSVCRRTRPCTGSRSGSYTCKSCLPRPRRECCRCRRLRRVNAEWPIG